MNLRYESRSYLLNLLRYLKRQTRMAMKPTNKIKTMTSRTIVTSFQFSALPSRPAMMRNESTMNTPKMAFTIDVAFISYRLICIWKHPRFDASHRVCLPYPICLSSDHTRASTIRLFVISDISNENMFHLILTSLNIRF